MEFFARKLPVPQHWVDFYNRVNEIIPGADLDIVDISNESLVIDTNIEAYTEIGITVRKREKIEFVDRPSITFLLFKNVPLEKILDIPDPKIFGEMKPIRWDIHRDGYKIPSASYWEINKKLELVYPDGSRIDLLIHPEEDNRRKKEEKTLSPLVSH